MLKISLDSLRPHIAQVNSQFLQLIFGFFRKVNGHDRYFFRTSEKGFRRLASKSASPRSMDAC